MRVFSVKNYFSLFTLALLLLAYTPLKAQSGDFTDQELKNFSKAVVEVITIQQQIQQEMIAQIEEQNLTIVRFNEMMGQAQELGEEGIEGTPEEVEAFYLVAQAIMVIQEQMIDYITRAIEEKDLSIERYEAILQAYQSDPELQARVHTLAGEN